MKKMLLLMLIPLLGIAQTPKSLTVNDYLAAQAQKDQLHLKAMQKAINYQNVNRSYFEYNKLVFDKNLTREAQKWADYLAIENVPQHSPVKDDTGELIFYAPKNWFKDTTDIMTHASVFWVLSDDDISKATTEQILCKKCDKVGFGISLSRDTYYVVAKYDKKGDFNN
tara:strand:- start:923 stop:1426 length:504 start_codon:yes stop_codon:yes gene_type:complete